MAVWECGKEPTCTRNGVTEVGVPFLFLIAICSEGSQVPIYCWVNREREKLWKIPCTSCDLNPKSSTLVVSILTTQPISGEHSNHSATAPPITAYIASMSTSQRLVPSGWSAVRPKRKLFYGWTTWQILPREKVTLTVNHLANSIIRWGRDSANNLTPTDKTKPDTQSDSSSLKHPLLFLGIIHPKHFCRHVIPLFYWAGTGALTEVKTSAVCWMVAIRRQPKCLNSRRRVGLCSVADGCVRKKVGKRARSDSAGELEPYDNYNER